MMKFATIGFMAFEAVSAADYQPPSAAAFDRGLSASLSLPQPRPQVGGAAKGNHEQLVQLRSTQAKVVQRPNKQVNRFQVSSKTGAVQPSNEAKATVSLRGVGPPQGSVYFELDAGAQAAEQKKTGQEQKPQSEETPESDDGVCCC